MNVVMLYLKRTMVITVGYIVMMLACSINASAITYSSTFSPIYPTVAYPDWITVLNSKPYGGTQFFDDSILKALGVNDIPLFNKMANSPWYVPEYNCTNMGNGYRLLSIYDVDKNMSADSSIVKTIFAFIDNDPTKPLRFDPAKYPINGKLTREVGTLYSEWGGDLFYINKHFSPDLGSKEVNIALTEFTASATTIFNRFMLAYTLTNQQNGLPAMGVLKIIPGAERGIAKVICVKDY